MKLTIEERVANGARWLDENFPGWEKRINIKTLNLASGESCICGQLFKRKAMNFNKKETGDSEGYNGYDYALVTLFEEANSWISGMVPKTFGFRRAERVAYVLGFSTDHRSYGKRSWDKLQDAWVDLLAKRVEARELVAV